MFEACFFWYVGKLLSWAVSCWCCWNGSACADLFKCYPIKVIDDWQAMATMKRLLEDHLMASVQPGEYFSPDEIEIVLDALAWYKDDPSGRKTSARCAWIVQKLLRARNEGSTITLTGS